MSQESRIETTLVDLAPSAAPMPRSSIFGVPLCALSLDEWIHSRNKAIEFFENHKQSVLRSLFFFDTTCDRDSGVTTEGSIETPRGSFPPTRWTLVQDVQNGGVPAEKALDELCKIYWLPVYAFLRREGAGATDAEDLTQGFFLRLLKSDSLSHADAGKGKLRSYLLGSLKRFRIDDYRSSTRKKRGSGTIQIPLDAEEFLADEPSEKETPEDLFERRWALSLLDEAFERTAEEFRASAKSDLFDGISPFLAGHDSSNLRHSEVATKLGMSQGAVQVAVYRLRKRYRRQLETVVGETLADPKLLEEELRHIFEILAT